MVHGKSRIREVVEPLGRLIYGCATSKRGVDPVGSCGFHVYVRTFVAIGDVTRRNLEEFGDSTERANLFCVDWSPVARRCMHEKDRANNRATS